MTDTSETFTDTSGNPVHDDRRFQSGDAGAVQPIASTITGEVFYAAAETPADAYGQLASLFANMPKKGDSGADSPEVARATIAAILNMVELYLLPETAERLAERLKSKDRPISVQRLMSVANTFLKDVYGGNKDDGDDAVRPTPPTSD